MVRQTEKKHCVWANGDLMSHLSCPLQALAWMFESLTQKPGPGLLSGLTFLFLNDKSWALTLWNYSVVFHVSRPLFFLSWHLWQLNLGLSSYIFYSSYNHRLFLSLPLLLFHVTHNWCFGDLFSFPKSDRHNSDQNPWIVIGPLQVYLGKFTHRHPNLLLPFVSLQFSLFVCLHFLHKLNNFFYC